jgi:sugar diacid utilization regulator
MVPAVLLVFQRNQMNTNDWQLIVEEMKQVLTEVENDDKTLKQVLGADDTPNELRQSLKIALAVLKDGRKVATAARATGMDADYLKTHLRPLLEALLGESDGTTD